MADGAGLCYGCFDVHGVFRQGFVRRGITVALLVMLLCWFINEVLMVKYVLALPKEDEVPEGEGAKVSENWLSLRKKYNTLDEVSTGVFVPMASGLLR